MHIYRTAVSDISDKTSCYEIPYGSILGSSMYGKIKICLAYTCWGEGDIFKSSAVLLYGTAFVPPHCIYSISLLF